MKLIVGLGNPGEEYKYTHHNMGFMVLDNYTDNSDWKSKFNGLYKLINVNGDKVFLLKPQTFMNLSGDSVIKFVNYYDIKLDDILVIQDDLDLEFLKFKLKKNSSSGGHNGIKSIINNLGSDGFCRLKIGIGHDRGVSTVDYVLGKFSKAEIKRFNESSNIFNDIIDSFITNGVEVTMNKYNTR